MEDRQEQNKKIDFIKHYEIVKCSRLTFFEKCLLIDLCSYSGKKGEVFPNQETLADDLGCSPRHIYNGIKKLLQEGYVNDRKRRGYSKSYRYFLSDELYFHNGNTQQNPSALQSGTAIPHYFGSDVPPNVLKEDKERTNIDDIKSFFETAARKKCSSKDELSLSKLCKKYSSEWVSDSIREASKHNLTYLSVNYLVSILENWQQYGKATPKPKLIACGQNGCVNGFIHHPGETSVKVCDCFIAHQKQVEEWKNKQPGGGHD